jgi:transposase
VNDWCGPEHAPEDCLESADCAVGERWIEAEGIAAAVSKSLLTVRRWRRRYAAEGADGLLKDATRPSRVKPLAPEKIKQVVHMTLHEKPPNATHWTGRSMAAAAGISYSSVQRIWRAHGLKPYLVKTFKVSRDRNFAAKVEDVVGLYLDPLVLCVDEKSQIQALDRTQPGLPMKKGRAGTMTHDYKRNGTTTLFAALNMLDGKVIRTCMPRHRQLEFLRFLKLIDQKTPAGLDLHLIVDNYATHKTPAVKRWLNAHPRFHLHFTPTSASWLNMVERFFAEITRNRIRRGAFKSVADLKGAIMQYLENHNADPKPFVWTKSASQILEKVARANQALESQH